MSKKRSVIYSVKKYNKYDFGQIQSVSFKAVKAEDGYTFLNGRNILFIPSNSFANVRRKGYKHDKKSLKLVMDMFISNNDSGIVGLAEYYGDIGDILCEYGVIYSKSGIPLIAVLEKKDSYKRVMVINKYHNDNEICRCMIKCMLDMSDSFLTYDIAVCDIYEYIKII